MVMDGNFVSIFHSLPLEASFWIPRRRRLYCHDSISQNKNARVEVDHARKPTPRSPTWARGSPPTDFLFFSLFIFLFFFQYTRANTSAWAHRGVEMSMRRRTGADFGPPVYPLHPGTLLFVLWRRVAVFMIWIIQYAYLPSRGEARRGRMDKTGTYGEELIITVFSCVTWYLLSNRCRWGLARFKKTWGGLCRWVITFSAASTD